MEVVTVRMGRKDGVRVDSDVPMRDQDKAQIGIGLSGSVVSNM